MKCVARIETGDGVFSAVFNDHGLAELSFPDRACRVQATDSVPKEWKRDTAAALECVLRGEQPEKLPPLDFSKGTPFQQKVWRALVKIPAGETRSYGEIAAAVGEPGAARAVGAACGANPIPVLVPCHRVVPNKGSPGAVVAKSRPRRHVKKTNDTPVNNLTRCCRYARGSISGSFMER